MRVFDVGVVVRPHTEVGAMVFVEHAQHEPGIEVREDKLVAGSERQEIGFKSILSCYAIGES